MTRGGHSDSGPATTAEPSARVRFRGSQEDLEAELAALRSEVATLHEKLDRDHALLKRARALLGKQLEEGVDDED